jgi:uncharacterized protein (DUF952 family)
MSTDIIFHFAQPDDWQRAQAIGFYSPMHWQGKGFIHCATQEQIPGVIERHLKARGAFIKLSLNAESLKPNLRYEWSDISLDHYPHIYAEIMLSSVIASEAVFL